ncbi:unnamed protein product, partial [Polarella glacialis]
MREGEAWRHLRELLDAAEDHGDLVWAINAHAVVSGSTKGLSSLGEDVLRHLLEPELRERLRGPGSGIAESEEAYALTRNTPLSELFEALGLDARLRHHRRPLTAPEKADVVRSIAGEIERSISVARTTAKSAPWRRALQRELASALLWLWEEQMREAGVAQSGNTHGSGRLRRTE